MQSVATAFLGHATASPDALFLRLNTGTEAHDHSYGAIAARARRFNAHFRGAGLPEGAVIAIILTHSADIYCAFLGAMMAGLVPTIMPFPTPKQDKAKYWESHRELFALSGIRALFTYAANVADVGAHLGGCIDWVATADDLDEAASSDAVTTGELAVLQHSSGTTALKKGVMLTHAAIADQVAAYAAAIGIARGDRIASWLPLYHDMGFVACFLMPMTLGCPVVHLDAFVWSARPTLLLDDLVGFGAAYAWLPNFAFNHIANAMRAAQSWDMAGVRALINCSEPCKPATFARFRALPQLKNLRPGALQVCYAMAENVFAVSQTGAEADAAALAISAASLRDGRALALAGEGEAASAILSCGRPVAGTEVAVLGADGPETAELRAGEIVIRGDSLYAGYYHRPEITAQRLVDGWHHTGDVGFLHAGELYVTGRIDDLLIVRGKNLYAHEIEEAMNELGLVIPGRAVAIADFDSVRGDAALVILAEADDPAREKEFAAAARRMVVDRFAVSLGDFRLLPPRTLRKTTSGKLSRVANAELYRELQS